MRDRERRLRRVTTRMTVRQRVAAMLAAGPGTTAVYDDIGRGLTPAGWAAFRRDCARLDQLNVMACVYLARADGTIDVLRLLVGWLATIRLTAAMTDQLEDALDYWSPRRGPGGAADRDLDGEVRTIAGVLRRAEEELLDAGAGDTLLRDGILHTHHLLRALEIEVAAFAADLAADPLDADLHAQADRCHAELADLIDLVTLDPPIALTEPVRRRRRRDCRPLPPRGGSGRCPLVRYLPDLDPIATPYHPIPLVSIARVVRVVSQRVGSAPAGRWVVAPSGGPIVPLRKQRVDDARAVAAPAAARSLLRAGCWRGRRDSNPRPSAWEASAVGSQTADRRNWAGSKRGNCSAASGPTQAGWGG